MKKLLLSLGALSAVVAPVAAVVACGSTDSTLSENGKKSLEVYKTQANALSDGDVKTASLTALGKIKSDQDLATFAQSQTGKDLMAAVMAGGVSNVTGTTVKSDAQKLIGGMQAEVRVNQADASILDIEDASVDIQSSIDAVLAAATKVGEIKLKFKNESKADRTVTFFDVKDSDDLKKLVALKGSHVIAVNAEDDATFNGVDPHATETMKTVFTDEIKKAKMTITKYVTPADSTDAKGDKITYAISFLNIDGSYTSPIAYLVSK